MKMQAKIIADQKVSFWRMTMFFVLYGLLLWSITDDKIVLFFGALFLIFYLLMAINRNRYFGEFSPKFHDKLHQYFCLGSFVSGIAFLVKICPVLQ